VKAGKMTRLASIVLMLAFLGSIPLQAASADPKYLMVAGITALSGPAAPWGIAQKNIWTLVVEEINDAGGFTVKGQQYFWKLKMYDHAMDPGKALTAATRAVTLDKAVCILELDPACAKASQQVSEKHKVITFVYGTPDKDLINPDNFHTFMLGLDADVAYVLYPWIAENTDDIRRIAIFQPDSVIGDRTAYFAVDAIKQLPNLKIVFDRRGDETATDFVSQLTSILAEKPDMIDVSNWDPGTGALIVKQVRELGFKGPVHIIAPDLPTLKEVTGWKNCENAFLSPYIVEETDAMKKFRAAFIKSFGEENWIGPIAYLGHDQLVWMTEGIQGSQSLDGTKIANYMTTMKTTSLWGSPCYMGGKSMYGVARIPLYPYYIGQVRGGKIVQVIDGEFPTMLR
jgi:branched-chain amino acid transport system substrate-binding protein